MKLPIRRLMLIVVLLLVMPMLAACQTAATGASNASLNSLQPSSTATSNTNNGSGNEVMSDISTAPTSMTIPQVVQAVRPGVVEVISEFGRGSVATGSGFVFDNQSHILTNNHVVAGASKITVVTSDNKILDATLVGRDPMSDVAVLKVDKKLQPLKLGNSDQLQAGQQVVAIGSALDLPGGPTVTTGVVSALERSQQEPSQMAGGAGPTLYGLIQTDAAVNPGNSGGPLLNMQGEVIGINTMGIRSTPSGEVTEGINFAISINTARSVAQELIKNGKVVYPYMGIYGTYLYPDTAVEYGLKYVPGQYISDVAPNTPASRAGLRRGDVITAINGQKLNNESSFMKILFQQKPGEKITLTIMRDGKQTKVKLTLAQRPASANETGGSPRLPQRP